MHRRGINYDTGFAPSGDQLSRESFEPAQVRREIEIIARDLHCNAVRISGRDADRIALAAEHALAEGLEVWFAPLPCTDGSRAFAGDTVASSCRFHYRVRPRPRSRWSSRPAAAAGASPWASTGRFAKAAGRSSKATATAT